MIKTNYIFYIFIYGTGWILVQGGYMENRYPKSVIEDATLDTAELIHKYKYPVETHYVTTEDKYILGVHRIPKPGAPPVFLMHGLEDSSSTWILMGPSKALGYYLYDSGYDVWMGNARGNRYSRNHTTLNPDTNQNFWSFSWHEIGFYDLPAMIDYVLTQTNFQKVGYFGHSQGTTSFWVLCSMRPEYNGKITVMSALAPVAFMKNVKTPLLGMGRNLIRASKGRVNEFMRYNKNLFRMCMGSKMAEDTCLDFVHNILGKETKQLNMTMLPTIFGHVPAGCNIKQFQHYLQMVDSDRFCQYDHGSQENTKRYGQSTPPDYPLEKITAPVALYYTHNDFLTNEVDVKRLAKILPNVVENVLYPYKKWNHITMSWGIDARKLAHQRMLEVMKDFPYE